MLRNWDKLSFYSISVNLLIVILTIALVLGSGKSQYQIIQEYLEDDEIPALTREGRFSSIGITVNLEEEILEVTENKISRYEAMFQINTEINILNTTVPSDIYFVSSEIWEQLSNESKYQVVIFEKTDDIAFDQLQNVSIPDLKINYTFSIDKITNLNINPQIIYGYSSFQYPVFDFSHVSLILPMSEYPKSRLTNTEMTYFREFYYLNTQFVSNSRTFLAIENEVSYLEILISTVWDKIDSEYVNSEYFLLNYFYYTERDIYEVASAILFVSIPKIIFLQGLILYGLYLLLQRNFGLYELLFSRGYSIDQIEKKVISTNSILPAFFLLFPLIGIFYFTDLQITTIYSILIPWIITYVFSSMWVIIHLFRNFRVLLIGNKQALDKKIGYRFYKFSFLISIYFLFRMILYLVGVKPNYQFGSSAAVFVPPDSWLFLSWAVIFFVFSLFLYIFEGNLVVKGVSHSLTTKMWFTTFLRKKGVFVLFLLILTMNLGFDNQLYSNVQRDQSIDNIRGNMGDFTIEFVGDYDNIIKDKLEPSDFQNIDELQSYLFIYRLSFDEIDPDHGKQGYYGITLINQTEYDNFRCSTCDNISKEKFFGNSIWIPEHDFPAFNSQKEPFEASLGYSRITLYPDMFAKLDEKSGVVSRGVNSMILSIQTWQAMEYPEIEILRLDQIYITMSFKDGSLINENDVISRVSNGLGIEVESFRVRSNEITRNFNALNENLITVFYFNTIFALFVGITFGHLVLGDKNLLKLRTFISKRYGGIKKLVYFNLISNILLIFLSIISYLLSIIVVFFGSRDNYWSYSFFWMDWNRSISYFFGFLLGQIFGQGLYSYFKRIPE